MINVQTDFWVYTNTTWQRQIGVAQG